MSTPRVVPIRRHAERAVPEQAPAILAAGLVAHVAVTAAGRPEIVPMLYGYDPHQPDVIYLHGLPSNATLRHLAAGHPVSLAVTLTDGLVYSKDAKYHSANYRSVVCSGHGQAITDPKEKWRV